MQRKLYGTAKRKMENMILCGLDEAGRGPLAGPIVACGVILDLNVLDDELILGLNDSKKINEKNKNRT